MSQPLPPDPTVAMRSPGVGSTSASVAGSDAQASDQAGEVQAPASDLSVLRPIQLRDAQGELPTPMVRSSGGKGPSQRDPTGRLQFQGEIARGGMGAILKGHDRFLGRDIAVKVLLQEHHDKPDFAQRFIEEAQITGQLQHPGIVPVYELGQFRDQRPFFTMKLVKGKTLAALMAARKTPADEPGRFIHIFVQLCQTLAYAHARGVIHRDLKPSNVMVGAFGEVQVMDWGLAKVLREGGVADEKKAQPRPDVSVIRTQRSSSPEVGEGSSTYTQAGSILGTPSYLAPEQARGDVELVDERADVFGLGAMLCELLTGDPPYTGRGAEATRKAQTGNLSEAWERLDGCGADADLINVAKHCLAVEPWDRPRDAGAVAKELAAYQNSVDQRLRQAELAHAAEAARAEEALHTAAEAKAKARAERQSRRMTLALAASVLVVAGLVAFGWRRFELDRMGRTSASNARVNAALQEAMRQRGQAQAASAGNPAPWAAAVTAARQAEALLETGVDPALREKVQSLLAEVNAGASKSEAEASAAEREAKLLDRLVDIRAAKEDDPGGSATDAGYADAFREAGLDVEALSPVAVAAQLKTRPREVALSLAAFLDDWTQLRRVERKNTTGAERLAQVAQALDPDPWRQKLREAMAQEAQPRLVILQELAKTANNEELGPISLDLLGKALAASRDPEAAATVLRAAQLRHPEDVWLNYDLASTLNRMGRRPESIRYYMAAHALRPELAHMLAHALQDVGEHDEAIRVFQELVRLRPSEGRHLACYGSALSTQGRKEEADKTYDAAIVALQEQTRAAPAIGALYNALGIAFTGKRQIDDAIAAYRKAHELDRTAATPRNNLRSALRRKVESLQSSGQIDAAIAVHGEAVELEPKDGLLHDDLIASLQQTPGKLDETIADYRKKLEADPQSQVARYGLPIALRAAGQLKDSIATFREAIELDPKQVWLLGRLAGVLRENGQLTESIATYRQALELEPRSGAYHNSLALALRANGELDEAISVHRKAIEIDPQVPPGHHNLGQALYAKGEVNEAIAEYRRALELDPKYNTAHDSLATALRAQGKLDETIAEYRKVLATDPKNAVARYGLGPALRTSGKLPEAIAAYRQAVELDPKQSWVHNYLGFALRSNGQLDEAIAAFQKAIELSPKYVAAHNNLGLALRDKRQFNEALSAFRKAVEIDPKYVSGQNSIGNVLRDQGQIDEAIAAYRKAIEIDPKYPSAHNGLGLALRSKGRFDEAVAAYRKAIELDARPAAYHHNLGLALRNNGQIDEAIAAYRKAIEIEPQTATYHNSLGWALPIVGQYDEAIAACRKAIELSPRAAAYHHSLAFALQGKGEIDAAVAAYQQAISLQADHFWANRDLADLLYAAGKHSQAAPHFETAISKQPKASELYDFGYKPNHVDLYKSACCAALAAAGSDKRSEKLDDGQVSHWRNRALEWLRLDLEARMKQLEDGKSEDRAAVVQALAAWQQDSNLASLREPEAIELLPAEQQEQCRKLWADVAAVLQMASNAR